jgi:hypothetical protein
VWSFVAFNDDRPPQPEALATLPALLARAAGATGWSISFSRDVWAFVVDGPWVQTAADVVTLGCVLLAGLVAAGYLRATRGRRGWGAAEAGAATATTGLVLLASPVLSPQYLGWLVPVVAVALLDGRQRLEGLLFVAACAVTTYVHPSTYEELVAGEAAPAVALLVRDLLLITIVARTAWPLLAALRPAAEPAPAPPGPSVR